MASQDTPQFTAISVDDPEFCYAYARGECPWGSQCGRAATHHANLDPTLADNKQRKEDPDYMVENEPRVACQRCLDLGRECDKKTNGRGGPEDPCSECRWFGGDRACKLVEPSYNDIVWATMMARSKQGYTLAPAKARDEVPEQRAPVEGQKKIKPKKAPAPIPAEKLMNNWVGLTRDEVLAKPLSILPDYVRKLPRAYLVKPRPTHAQRKPDHFKPYKRDREAMLDAPASFEQPPMGQSSYGQPTYGQRPLTTSDPLFPAERPSFLRPLPHPQFGKVKSTAWNYDENRWEHHYENGKTICSQPLNALGGPTPAWYSKHADASFSAPQRSFAQPPPSKKPRLTPTAPPSSAVVEPHTGQDQDQDATQQQASNEMEIDTAEVDDAGSFGQQKAIVDDDGSEDFEESDKDDS